MKLPLHERLPPLASIPVAGLLSGPTPVEPLRGVDQTWIKRDDVTATDYGGNKIRKLDFILADAVARRRRSVVVFGYAGSNFVAATAWHGRKLGLSTIGGLLPQVGADYVADNLSVSLASHAQLFLRDSESALVATAAARSFSALLREGGWPLWIPPGGSSPLGALGFVNAAFELERQVAGGLLPAPRSIVLPFSSMGTVAGLATGLQLAGLEARITAVQVVDEHHASRARLVALLARLERRLRKAGVATVSVPQALERVDIRTEFYGGEYARADDAVKTAMQRFAQDSGARADSAYTGKALACLYAGGLPGPVLYWHTLSACRLPPGVRRAVREKVPVQLRAYWPE